LRALQRLVVLVYLLVVAVAVGVQQLLPTALRAVLVHFLAVAAVVVDQHAQAS
jgi:hypothetical protein